MSTSYDSLNKGYAKTLLVISNRLEKILEFIGKIGAWLAIPLIA